jgi:hypothetical protein
MRYLLLIYNSEAQNMQQNQAEMEAEMGAYNAFGDEAQNAGVLRGGEALQPTATATTVSVRNGKTVTTDGPFAETKEQLGGFYLVDCANLDEAIHWGAKIPGAKKGSIEVRPIWEFTQG